MGELELADGCRRGDNKARRELYERYAGRMLALCQRYVGSREEAEDLLHDGFLKLYSSFDKFTWRGEGSLRAWIERVMTNIALQYLRRTDVLSQSAALDTLPLESYDEPEAETAEQIPQRVLLKFVSELPAGYRTVFNLYVFENKSHKEIAQMLSIKSGRLWYIRRDSRNFDLKELLVCIDELSQLDIAIKTGKIDKYKGLELFLMRMGGNGKWNQ